MSNRLPSVREPVGFKLSLADLGNAQRLVHHFGANIRWVGLLGKWLFFDGQRWVTDETGELMRCAKATALAIAKEVDAWRSEDEQESLYKWAKTSKGRARLEAMLALGASEPGVPVVPDQLNANPWLLNVQNGTVDLETGELRPHSPDDLQTRICTADFNPEATSPLWESFLDKLTGGSKDLQGYLQRAVGCALSGAENDKALFVLHGQGDTGKTTFLRVIMVVLGDYAVQAERNLLLERSNEAHPTGIADLFGRRLAICTEVNKTQHFDAALVKQLTGGDRLKARRMRQDFFEFDPTHTLFLACNDVPGVDATDEALWRRLRIIPFTHSVPANEQDPHLVDKLLEDRDAILAWAVEACRAWQAGGLAEPSELRDAKSGHRKSVDPIFRFVDEMCARVPGDKTGATDLFDAYKAWAKNIGAATQKAFGQRLASFGFSKGRGSGGRIIYRDITLVKGLKGSPLSTQQSETEREVQNPSKGSNIVSIPTKWVDGDWGKARVSG